MKKIVVFLGAVTIGALLAGCISEPVINEFMDPNLPVREHAALSVQSNVIIGQIDSSISFSGKYGGNSYGKEPVLLLAPGNHNLSLMYYDGSTRTDGVVITQNFEAGRYYRLYPEHRGNQIAFIFKDQTVEGIWDTEPLASAQLPKQKASKSTSTSTTTTLPRPGNMSSEEYRKAVIEASKSSEQTVLEGKWKAITGVNTYSLTIMGNVYIFENWNQILGHVGDSYGILEISDNNLTMYAYAAEIFTDPKYAGLVYYNKPIKSKSKWTLQDTDTLVLNNQLTYKRDTSSDNAE